MALVDPLSEARSNNSSSMLELFYVRGRQKVTQARGYSALASMRPRVVDRVETRLAVQTAMGSIWLENSSSESGGDLSQLNQTCSYFNPQVFFALFAPALESLKFWHLLHPSVQRSGMPKVLGTSERSFRSDTRSMYYSFGRCGLKSPTSYCRIFWIDMFTSTPDSLTTLEEVSIIVKFTIMDHITPLCGVQLK